MQYYLIKPKDPLIIRSGRPFEEISDVQAARFPPPSTLAGALRNIHARSTEKALNAELLKLRVTGPLAVKLPINGDVPTVHDILVPKPADVQYFYDNDTKETRLIRSNPIRLDESEGCDLPNGLQPLLAEKTRAAKPVSGPNWWALDDLIAWRKGEKLSFKQISGKGWLPADPDIRTHISIDNLSRNAKSGKIFQTTGLNMWPRSTDEQTFPESSIGILGGINGEINKPLLNFGGERRLAEITPCALWPKIPHDFAQTIANTKAFTITFLTPTLFDGGWLPSWLDENTFTGTPPCCQRLQVKLYAAAIERWVPQSGWDLDKNKPRAAQRMIPAGATYWFEIIGDNPPLEELDTLWMSHLCDNEQNNLNGFGLALAAAYDLNS